jgi:hypothetical protein
MPSREATISWPTILTLLEDRSERAPLSGDTNAQTEAILWLHKSQRRPRTRKKKKKGERRKKPGDEREKQGAEHELKQKKKHRGQGEKYRRTERRLRNPEQKKNTHREGEKGREKVKESKN